MACIWYSDDHGATWRVVGFANYSGVQGHSTDHQVGVLTFSLARVTLSAGPLITFAVL